MKLDGRKIYIGEDWLEILIKNINKNIEINRDILKQDENSNCERKIEENQMLIDKLNRYKKYDSDNNCYFYLFPNELETIMWVLLENSFVFRIGD